MRIENDVKLDFKDVLIRPKRSTLTSRKDVKLERTFIFKNSGRSWTGIPIVSSNMDATGTFEVAKVLQEFKMITCIHKHYTLDDWDSNMSEIDPNYVAVSIGITNNDLKFLEQLLTKYKDLSFICVDVANGYQECFVDTIKQIRNKYPTKTIIAGNIVTGEMVEELIIAGADIIKAGIGGGSVCTTRKQTGVGYPQLSTVIECADAAHGLSGHLMSDGGCVVPGDVAKAFGACADFCMLGGMFAGHIESGGETEIRDGITYKVFYGMSSDTAMVKYKGSVAKYRSSEGKTVSIKCRGSVKDTVLDMLGGLRSACTYTGSIKLKELSKRTTFVRVTQQLNQSFGV
jgi:GMP reductase